MHAFCSFTARLWSPSSLPFLTKKKDNSSSVFFFPLSSGFRSSFDLVPMSNCLLETMRPIVPFTREVKVAGEGQAEQEIKTRVGTKSTKMQLLLAAQVSPHIRSFVLRLQTGL